jgi:hypothetical protein
LVTTLTLVALGVAAYVIFLAGPFQMPSDIKDRAPIGGSIGGLLGLLAAIVAITTAMWINSADFKAEQAVKGDTARLRANLRMILTRGALISQRPNKVMIAETFEKELEAIVKFATSTTGFGFWSLIDSRSTEAAKHGGGAEDWRMFFMTIANLLEAANETGDLFTLFSSAAWLEEQLSLLKVEDIDAISRYVSNLAGALGNGHATNDILLSSMIEVYGRGSKHAMKPPVESGGEP